MRGMFDVVDLKILIFAWGFSLKVDYPTGPLATLPAKIAPSGAEIAPRGLKVAPR